MVDYTTLTSKNGHFIKEMEIFDIVESINGVLEILEEKLKV